MLLLSVDVQVYLVSLGIGLMAPGLIFWMLYRPLTHFLHAIFERPKIERFWLRVCGLVLYAWTLSTVVGFQPDASIEANPVALMWNLGDQLQAILHAILWSLLSLFLPLLLSFTILHVGRRQSTVDQPESRSRRTVG